MIQRSSGCGYGAARRVIFRKLPVRVASSAPAQGAWWGVIAGPSRYPLHPPRSPWPQERASPHVFLPPPPPPHIWGFLFTLIFLKRGSESLKMKTRAWIGANVTSEKAAEQYGCAAMHVCVSVAGRKWSKVSRKKGSVYIYFFWFLASDWCSRKRSFLKAEVLQQLSSRAIKKMFKVKSDSLYSSRQIWCLTLL